MKFGTTNLCCFHPRRCIRLISYPSAVPTTKALASSNTPEKLPTPSAMISQSNPVCRYKHSCLLQAVNDTQHKAHSNKVHLLWISTRRRNEELSTVSKTAKKYLHVAELNVFFLLHLLSIVSTFQLTHISLHEPGRKWYGVTHCPSAHPLFNDSNPGQEENS